LLQASGMLVYAIASAAAGKMQFEQRLRPSNHFYPPGSQYEKRGRLVFRWTMHPHEIDLGTAARML
jgi:hypothetical protein